MSQLTHEEESGFIHAGAGRIQLSAAMLCLAFAAVHVVMTVLYLSPPNLLKLAMQQPVSAYMRPVFEQDWHLFSPDPAVHTVKLAVRCSAPNESWGAWADPFARVQSDQYTDRASSKTKLLYVLRSVARNLSEAHVRLLDECQGGKCDPIVELQKTDAYLVALRAARRVCMRDANGAGIEAGRVQCKVLEFFPAKYSERSLNSARRWSRVSETVMPAESLRPGAGT